MAFKFPRRAADLAAQKRHRREAQKRVAAAEKAANQRIARAKKAQEGPAQSKARKNRIVPPNVRMYVWRRDEGRCVECGSKEKLEYDHIIPVSKGGSNTERNVQLLCESCNRKKCDKIM